MMPSLQSIDMKFSGYQFLSAIILQAVRYKLNYREIEARDRRKKRAVSDSWRMDETYVKVKGIWMYYYRAVDTH